MANLERLIKLLTDVKTELRVMNAEKRRMGFKEWLTIIGVVCGILSFLLNLAKWFLGRGG